MKQINGCCWSRWLRKLSKLFFFIMVNVPSIKRFHILGCSGPVVRARSSSQLNKILPLLSNLFNVLPEFQFLISAVHSLVHKRLFLPVCQLSWCLHSEYDLKNGFGLRTFYTLKSFDFVTKVRNLEGLGMKVCLVKCYVFSQSIKYLLSIFWKRSTRYNKEYDIIDVTNLQKFGRISIKARKTECTSQDFSRFK